MLKRFLNKKADPFDPITMSGELMDMLPTGLPKDAVRKKMLDVLLSFGVPFNRWLGMKIEQFSPDEVIIKSPPAVLRRNHVGTAHAAALALLGEYPAGLLVAQRFPLETYRFIISKLDVDYHRAGKGTLYSQATAPVEWPELVDGEGWIDMLTVITNQKGETVAECKTKWQVKTWEKIRATKANRS